MRRKGLRLTLCWTRLVAGLSGGSIGFDDLVQAAPTPLGPSPCPRRDAARRRRWRQADACRRAADWKHSFEGVAACRCASSGSIGFDDLVQAAPTPLGAFFVPPPRRCSPPALASSRRVPARGRLEAFVRGGCRVSVREAFVRGGCRVSVRSDLAASVRVAAPLGSSGHPRRSRH